MNELKAYVVAKGRYDDQKKALAMAKAEMDAKESALLDRWAEDGIQSMNVNGRVFYIRGFFSVKLRDKDVPRETVAEALEAEGLGALIKRTYNLGDVSAHFAPMAEELDNLDDVLPELLSQYLEPIKGYRISSRKA